MSALKCHFKTSYSFKCCWVFSLKIKTSPSYHL